MNQIILFVCIIEDDNRRQILKCTKELFLSSDYNLVYKNNDIIGLYNGTVLLLIFDVLYKDMKKIDQYNFDIVVHSFIKGKKNNQVMNNLFKNSSVSIVNADDEDLELNVPDSSIFITYGFKSKSTVTVSSYNLNDGMALNIFLQREILPFIGNKLEPFECKLKALTSNITHIHSVLAAATLNLLIGDSIITKDLSNTLIKN